ncbi:Mur ligase domain-containing protein [Alkalicoccus chagannorensis]|uniref:Mur ligase domain-containing protein n=1 Tax=Alkalicoccus chagannorensis TaxID=427072 RepID=UPI00040002C7|nr:Mur ligase domain-containing protein [Alkalicoccus chagannorensis]
MIPFLTSERISAYASEVRGKEKAGPFRHAAGSIYEIENGSLFIAKKDSRYDGHQFIEAAVESGASGALWHKDEPIPSTIPDDFPLYLVDDTEKVLRQLAADYLSEHQAQVVFVEGDYTAQILLRMLRVWTDGRKTLAVREKANRQVSAAELVLSMDQDIDIVFIEAVESDERMHELAALLRPDIAVISYRDKDMHRRYDEEPGVEQTIRASLHPAEPATEEIELPYWLQGFQPLAETAASVVNRLTGAAVVPPELLQPEVFGMQTMQAGSRGLVLFEAESMEKADLDYAVGFLSDTGNYRRRVLVIDEGFQADRYHKTIHALFAAHIPLPVTDVFAVGEKAFWVHEALMKSERDDIESSYYSTHVEAVDDLREALRSSSIMLYKGANRELIYEILHQLNRD